MSDRLAVIFQYAAMAWLAFVAVVTVVSITAILVSGVILVVR